MDHRSVKDEGAEVDIESGLVVNEDDSKNVCTATTPSNTKQGKTMFAKVSCGLVGVGDSTIKGDDRHSVYSDESNLTLVSIDMVKLTNKLGQYSVECAQVKEKRKSSSNKKSPKPPRAPRAPSLDAADQKLIREITQLAMLKRARIERMKALKKMKAAKTSSSSNSSMFAMVFTVVFCIVILLQGMSSGKSSVASFQGSPVAAEVNLIPAQIQLNPSSRDTNVPALESHKVVHQEVTGFALTEKLRREAG